MQSIVTLYVLFIEGIQRGIEWCSPWSQRAFRDKREASSLARSRNLVRFKIGWEWFYGKLLLNHSAVCSFIRSRAGACKMIHDVSLFLKPQLQLSGTHCFLLCVHDSALWEKILLTHFFFFDIISFFFFFCDSMLLHIKSNTSRFCALD